MPSPSKAKKRIYPVVLSGGQGTRLWPLSRALYPKQLLPLASSRTLLQETVLRLKDGADFAPATVVCGSDHRFIIAEQLQAIGVKAKAIILEPVGRNTAPAAAAAAALVAADDPDAILAVLPSDHVIADAAGFRKAVKQAAKVAAAGHMVTFGIAPASAHTGYGYIRKGPPIDGTNDVFAVDRFTEKPDGKTAETFLNDGGYYWNSGMFVFGAEAYLAELAKFHPDMAAKCRDAVATGSDDLDFFRLAPGPFEACKPESIDYAVMELTDKAAVIPVTLGWNDIGSWSALWDIGEKDESGNVLLGDVLAQDVRNSYLRSENALVAAIGVEDLMIIQTADAVLVTPKDSAQNVRAVVERLRASGRDEHETHVRHYRPWGYWETLDEGPRFQVKRLMLKPGAQLSLQKHHHRAEHWIVVAGTAKVERGAETLLLSENESTYIPLGTAHRLENPGKIELEVIEVQSGAYLGEDDIVRFEDVYNRDPSETK